MSDSGTERGPKRPFVYQSQEPVKVKTPKDRATPPSIHDTDRFTEESYRRPFSDESVERDPQDVDTSSIPPASPRKGGNTSLFSSPNLRVSFFCRRRKTSNALAYGRETCYLQWKNIQLKLLQDQSRMLTDVVTMTPRQDL